MNRRLVWLGVAAFVVALLAVLPVRWITGLLPADVQCAAWSGSLWNGQCAGLVIRQKDSATEVKLLRWKLHPAALLRLAISADLDVHTAQGTGSGKAELGRNGRVAVEHLTINTLFDRRLATMLADGWSGQLEGRDLTVKMQENTLQALAGEISLRDFNDGKGTAFGSYRLVFPRNAGAPFRGTLSDTGGPLEVKALVTIGADRHWHLDGKIMPRPDASQSLRSRLDIFGPPDETGRYQILSEGTFK